MKTQGSEPGTLFTDHLKSMTQNTAEVTSRKMLVASG